MTVYYQSVAFKDSSTICQNYDMIQQMVKGNYKCGSRKESERAEPPVNYNLNRHVTGNFDNS